MASAVEAAVEKNWFKIAIRTGARAFGVIASEALAAADNAVNAYRAFKEDYQAGKPDWWKNKQAWSELGSAVVNSGGVWAGAAAAGALIALTGLAAAATAPAWGTALLASAAIAGVTMAGALVGSSVFSAVYQNGIIPGINALGKATGLMKEPIPLPSGEEPASKAIGSTIRQAIFGPDKKTDDPAVPATAVPVDGQKAAQDPATSVDTQAPAVEPGAGKGAVPVPVASNRTGGERQNYDALKPEKPKTSGLPSRSTQISAAASTHSESKPAVVHHATEQTHVAAVQAKPAAKHTSPRMQ